MQKEQILSYLTDHKAELFHNGIEKIGLFGSFATNRENIYSDIDIAIKIKKTYLEEHDVWEYFTLIDTIKKMLLKKFLRNVDVYDLDSTGTINEEISKEVIYV